MSHRSKSSKSGKELENEIINDLSRFQPSEMIFNSEFNKFKTVSEFIKLKLNCSYSVRSDECFETAKFIEYRVG